MSNHRDQAAIDLHHKQVNEGKLRKLKKQYDREHRKQQRRREMKALGIAWEMFKAIYLACVVSVLLSGLIYALSGIYGS